MAFIKLYEHENLDSALRRFKRKCQDEKIIEELRKREFYLSPAQKRRKKSKEAQQKLKYKKKK